MDLHEFLICYVSTACVCICKKPLTSVTTITLNFDSKQLRCLKS